MESGSRLYFVSEWVNGALSKVKEEKSNIYWCCPHWLILCVGIFLQSLQIGWFCMEKFDRLKGCRPNLLLLLSFPASKSDHLNCFWRQATLSSKAFQLHFKTNSFTKFAKRLKLESKWNENITWAVPIRYSVTLTSTMVGNHSILGPMHYAVIL